MTHELKCWPEYFQAVKNGAKPFEVRKWERPYKVGDMLILREYDPKTMDYTGDSVEREITYVLDMTYLPGDNIPHFAGYAVFGLSTLKSAEAARAEKAEETLEAALMDMKTMADCMRESEGMEESPCWACRYDPTNIDCDIVGECPGYERDDCFEWRGSRHDRTDKRNSLFQGQPSQAGV